MIGTLCADPAQACRVVGIPRTVQREQEKASGRHAQPGQRVIGQPCPRAFQQIAQKLASQVSIRSSMAIPLVVR